MTLRVSSVFKDLLLAYRDIQLASGIKMATIERQLNYFDEFIKENNIKDIKFDHDTAIKWLNYRSEQGPLTRNIRISWSIHFLNYLKSLGYEVYIPRLPRYVASRFQAYIFSDDEIKRYFENIDTYFSNKDPFVALYLPAIFRILYTSGTRVGETLSIKVKDVDFENGIIKLKETKNGKERYVVLNEDVRILLNKYANKCLYLKTDDDYFFSHIDKRRISEQSVYRFHRKALRDSNIKYIGRGSGPRLHDLRHTFAVKSLIKFEKEGFDLNNVLPILSKYLGHSNISATEKYIRLVADHFDDFINRTKGITAYLMDGDQYESN